MNSDLTALLHLEIASAGPGYFSTVMALVGVAGEAGARTMVVTAQPEGPAPRSADVMIELPAQTMANDLGGPASLLPMGSLYEAAQITKGKFCDSRNEPGTGPRRRQASQPMLRTYEGDSGAVPPDVVGAVGAVTAADWAIRWLDCLQNLPRGDL